MAIATAGRSVFLPERKREGPGCTADMCRIQPAGFADKGGAAQILQSIGSGDYQSAWSAGDGCRSLLLSSGQLAQQVTPDIFRDHHAEKVYHFGKLQRCGGAPISAVILPLISTYARKAGRFSARHTPSKTSASPDAFPNRAVVKRIITTPKACPGGAFLRGETGLTYYQNVKGSAR